MSRMEGDLGSSLDWLAVDHWNTDNPHTHVVLRGRDHTGQDLIIARDYIAHGMRQRACELATEWLGPRTEREISEGLLREVEQERWTSLDRGLQQLAQQSPDGAVELAVNADTVRQPRALLIGRLQRLTDMGLPQPAGMNRWRLRPDIESTLRAMGERGTGPSFHGLSGSAREAEEETRGADWCRNASTSLWICSIIHSRTTSAAGLMGLLLGPIR